MVIGLPPLANECLVSLRTAFPSSSLTVYSYVSMSLSATLSLRRASP